jgi:NhaP-type Na+/H+ or K+/H+ antiporter
MRGGLELKFKGKGILVLLFTLVPQITEAACAAVLSRLIFDLPWLLCIPNGILLSALSPGVVVPSVMILIDNKYGIKKKIPQTMLAACSLDNLVAVLMFSVTVHVAENSIPEDSGEDENILSIIFWSLLWTFMGIIVGVLLGLSLKCITIWPANAKAVVMVSISSITPIICSYYNVPQAKFVGIIFFGYGCFKVWGLDKPGTELAEIWKWIQPFLFGSIGATILFSKVNPEQIWLSVEVILICLVVRFIAAYLSTSCFPLKRKERAFMAFSWMPKATV